jgi:4-amino-4-deoxy-L-arabinose transferase-like glycosyltransferase
MKLATKRFAYRRWLCRSLATRQHLGIKAKCIIGFSLFIISFSIKSLQAVDIEPTMHTADQPGGGMSSDFDARALAIVAGEGILMRNISDRSDTSLLAHAPGYPIFLSAVYAVSGRSYFTVQLIQNLVNSFSPVLIFLIAGHLISWRVGIASGVLSAVSHHLSYYSNLVLSDSLCPLPILLAVYLLVRVGFRRHASLWVYALAGSMIGLSAWIRPNPMLMGLASIPLLVIVSGRHKRVILNGVVLASATFLTIAPITIRNYLLYGEFVPIRIGIGIVLWQGLGDASGGRFGARTDDEVILSEVALYDKPSYGESWASPDGITRDRDRVRRSLEIIAAHPVWYLGTVFGRMGEMLKDTADAPLVFRSTDTKLLEAISLARSARSSGQKPDRLDEQQSDTIDRSALKLGRSISWLRPPARAIQRVTKETGLPFILAGLLILCAASGRRTLVILFVPLYYLLFQSVMHAEFRYTLSMRYFLFVLAALVWTLLLTTAVTLLRKGVPAMVRTGHQPGPQL